MWPANTPAVTGPDTFIKRVEPVSANVNVIVDVVLSFHVIVDVARGECGPLMKPHVRAANVVNDVFSVPVISVGGGVAVLPAAGRGGAHCERWTFIVIAC